MGRGDMVGGSETADDTGRRDGHRQGGRREDVVRMELGEVAVVAEKRRIECPRAIWFINCQRKLTRA
jgi:hypothetical protein